MAPIPYIPVISEGACEEEPEMSIRTLTLIAILVVGGSSVSGGAPANAGPYTLSDVGDIVISDDTKDSGN